MEYCEGGDLGMMIKRCREEKTIIPEYVIWKFTFQIFEALKACHLDSKGTIIHRDLKPGNIFLDANKSIKLGDFGLS